MQILLIDNYDSFTYNLYDYLLQLGADCRVMRNDEMTPDAFESLQFDAAVLSPGPGRPNEAGVLMPFIDYFHRRKPLLGVCLGHQAIGEFFGAPLVHAAVPMHGKTSRIVHGQTGLFEDIDEYCEVMRYHSLLLATLEHTPLRVTARTEQGEIMAFEHENLPIWGVQFHPESVLTPDGLTMMGNWVKGLPLRH